ncbi:hypothetical protein [Methanobrevibacter sp.]|uniref:hypothetical protein n=1 Tax=Methanobrevibacter sp. TaxID=66852 RepID=UPI0025D888DE|nr:hypothetical protein [Methanobrevibacter sp.]MBQ2832160.1 hypothetical protein [Methanobrevibacter sp.]
MYKYRNNTNLEYYCPSDKTIHGTLMKTHCRFKDKILKTIWSIRLAEFKKDYMIYYT